MSTKEANSEYLRLSRYLTGKLQGIDPHTKFRTKQIAEDMDMFEPSVKKYLDRHFNGLFNTNTAGIVFLDDDYSFEEFQEMKNILESEVGAAKERSR